LNAACSEKEPEAKQELTAEQQAQEDKAKQEEMHKRLNDTSAISTPSSGRSW
jgi:hypothetical protein